VFEKRISDILSFLQLADICLTTFLYKIYRDFTVASCQLPFFGVKITVSMKEQGE